MWVSEWKWLFIHQADHFKREKQNSAGVQIDGTQELNFHKGTDMDKTKANQLALMLIYCLDKMVPSPISNEDTSYH